MKKVKNLISKLSIFSRHEILGNFKNVLFVGGREETSQNLINSLDKSFNVFSIFNKSNNAFNGDL